jgi:pimeloyl-ACP methyl ester carboxylesterase
MGTMAPPVLLIHGGLGEDVDADRFWARPGVLAGLEAAGLAVRAPDRDTTPGSWHAAAESLVAELVQPTSIVAGSNGVSIAVRLVIDHPACVDRLVLAWPATAGDAVVDAHVPRAAAHLLSGDTLRGVADDDLRTVDVPVLIVPSDPPNRAHASHTVQRLGSLVRHATVTAGFPAAPRPEFAPRRGAFLEAIVPHLRAPTSHHGSAPWCAPSEDRAGEPRR